MNVTNHFVFVHMPKTGGSFVAEVLRTLYGVTWLHNLLLRNEQLLLAKNKLLRVIGTGRINYEEFNKHGLCNDIPSAFNHLPILSCIRNPFDWYVSNYKYAWWRSHPQDYPGLRNDPRWPNLSFDDYMDLSNSEWLGLLNPGVSINRSLGRLSVLFINYYCKHPQDILSLHDDNELFSAVCSDMYPVDFLNTANLNIELYNYLLKTGNYSFEQLAFIKDKGKVSPRNHRKPEDTWASFFSDKVFAEIQFRERMLFHLFPQLKLKS